MESYTLGAHLIGRRGIGVKDKSLTSFIQAFIVHFTLSNQFLCFFTHLSPFIIITYQNNHLYFDLDDLVKDCQ